MMSAPSSTAWTTLEDLPVMIEPTRCGKRRLLRATPTEILEEAKQAGLANLKGHRSVGGMRASIYNAVPEEAVDALITFMRDFEARRG
jgi:hypothetical protein